MDLDPRCKRIQSPLYLQWVFNKKGRIEIQPRVKSNIL